MQFIVMTVPVAILKSGIKMQSRILMFAIEVKDEDAITGALMYATRALEENGIHIVKGVNAPANIIKQPFLEVYTYFPSWLKNVSG